MGLFVGDWSDEPMPVNLESFLFCHILGGRILGDCLEERVQHSIVVLASVDRFEPSVLNS